MKFIYLVIFALLVSCSNKKEQKQVKSGQITFEHVGSSDKSWNTVIVTTFPMSEDIFERVVMVDGATFNSIYEFVDQQEDSYRGKYDASTWQAFQISTRADNLIGVYLISSDKSNNYFKDLKKFLTNLEGKTGIAEIQKEVDILIKRTGG